MSNTFYNGQVDWLSKLNEVAHGRTAYYIGPWAGRPNPVDMIVGTVIIITDIGSNNRSWWWSNGTKWLPQNGTLVLESRSLDTITYSNTATEYIPGWSYILPEGMFQSGFKLRTMFRAVRDLGGTGNWTAGVGFRKVGAAGYPLGNYASHIGTSTTTALHGQGLGIIEMTNAGVRRAGGWGYAWSGVATNASATIQPVNATNPGAGEPIELFLTGGVVAGNTASFLDIVVELLT